MDAGFTVIENKLKQFVKKYHLNNLIRGLVFFITISIIIGFVLLISEYFIYLKPNQKIFLLVIYLLAVIASFIYFIVIPFSGFIGVINNISNNKINSILIRHFSEIKDKLLNLLELNEQKEETLYSSELLLASINQKIEHLKPFDFKKAINLKENLKFIYILLFIVFTSSIITIATPESIKSSADRLVNYNQLYVKPSPYSYQILNEILTTGKGENFKLEVQVVTERDIQNVYISIGGNLFLMRNEQENFYSYQFPTLNNNVNFQFVTEGFYSELYTIEVLPKPNINSFSVEIQKPAYTALKNEVFNNITELSIPAGSYAEFTFNTIETSAISIIHSNVDTTLNSIFNYSKRFLSNDILSVSIENKHFRINDYLKIDIRVIKDEYPIIYVDRVVDESDFTRIYFRGVIEDDYGFEKLNFITAINDQVDSIFQLQIFKNSLSQDFLYAFDFKSYATALNSIQYYFEVYDNDRLNGYKSTRSQVFTFNFPDPNQIFEYQNEQNREIEQIVNESMMLTREIQKDIEDLQQKLINSELNAWERNEIIKNITSKKQSLEDALDQIKQRNEELQNYMQSFTEQDREIVEKQMQIQKMLEDVMTDELRQLIDEFNKMMEEFNEMQMNDLRERMDISLDDLQQQLDRNLEMLKKMKVEQQLNQIQNNLDKHIEEQQKLSDLIEQGSEPSSLIDQQNKEKESLQKLKDQYNQIEELNKELQFPINMYNFDEEFDQIDKEFEQSIQNQQQNNKDNSQQSIQKNKQQMSDLSSMLMQMIDAAFEEQRFENMYDLLQILDNVVTFSFNQEELIVVPQGTEFDSKILQEQKKLYQDFRVIKDSLYALGMREPSVNIAVNKEIVNIENNFRLIDNHLAENRVSQAKINQQNVLTSANEIALFLSEVIKHLQQQMANSMPGSQNCQRPGNNPSQSDAGDAMKSMQQSLQQQLDKMMQMMQEGASGSQMQGEFGRAMAQQEMLQNMIQQMMNQGGVGSEAQETLKQADELLNQIKEDLLRNNLSERTINRNQQILTRLLQAERAETERDIDERREAETAKEQLISESVKYFENIISNDKFEERLIKQRLLLNRYYQQRYQSYMNQLDSINATYY